MSKYTFYTNPQSRSRIVSWMLAECGLVDGCDYTTVNLEYGSSEAGGMKSKEYLAINPMGKVPTLVVHSPQGDVVISETPAICAYLADAYPEKQLAPSVSDPLRGAYYRWLLYIHGVLGPMMDAKSVNLLAPTDKAKSIGYGSYDDVLRTLKTTLADKTYLCGGRFTTADLVLSAYIGWYMQFDMLPKLPEFEIYVAKHTMRAAFKQRQPDA